MGAEKEKQKRINVDVPRREKVMVVWFTDTSVTLFAFHSALWPTLVCGVKFRLGSEEEESQIFVMMKKKLFHHTFNVWIKGLGLLFSHDFNDGLIDILANCVQTTTVDYDKKRIWLTMT